MNLPLTIKLKYLILISLTLGTILIIITISEIIEGKKDIYQSKKDEAFSLLRTVQKAGENVYISNQEVEDLIREKLINAAYYLAREESKGELSRESFNKTVAEAGIEHAAFYNWQGEKVLSNRNHNAFFNLTNKYKDELDSINTGAYDYFIPGMINDQNGKPHYSVVLKSFPPMEGFLVVSFSSEKLLDFRKKIGIGNLIQKIADTDEIVYLAIQDENGIITANQGIDELSSFSSDNFLTSSIANQQFASREIVFRGDKIFEAVKPFKVNDELIGVIRIGLSLKQVDHLINRIIIRSIAISFLLLLTGIILLILITDKQNLSLLKDQYRKIQTYTGNILNNMSEGVIGADKHGKIELMNPSAENILGFKEGDGVGLYCQDIIKDSESIIEKAISNNAHVEYSEQYIRTKTNKNILIGGSADLVRNDDGSINTVVAVIKDVTLQKSIEETQKNNEKLSAMGELAAGVAHEIKNPLNSIGIIVQRFEKEYLPDHGKEEYVDMINIMKSEIERLGGIINQFLNFAKPPKASLKEIDSNELLTDVYKLFFNRSIRDNIKLTVDIVPTFIMGDFAQLKQALINILQNAFDAVKAGGQIKLISLIEETNLVICISDNGPGIPNEILGKIFNLYYTTKQTGSGLGLSIVHQIITEHNGTIKVESKPGEGTKFILKIPIILTN